MYQQSQQLAIIEVLPDDIEYTETLTNRALDVRTASMVFLAVHICHNKTPLGTLGIIVLFRVIIGRVIKTGFLGDERITNAAAFFGTCVDNYARTLSNIHTRISIESYKILKGTVPSLNSLRTSADTCSLGGFGAER